MLYHGLHMGLHETPTMGERAGGACETPRPCTHLEGAVKGTKYLPPGVARVLRGSAPSIRGQEWSRSWVLLASVEVVLPSLLGTAVVGRVNFVGKSVFHHVWFWIQMALLKWFVGSFPLAPVWLTSPCSQDCTTQVPFGARWPLGGHLMPSCPWRALIHIQGPENPKQKRTG